MAETSTPPDAAEIPYRRTQALAMLEALSRDQAIQTAVHAASKQRCGWVKAAYAAGTLEVRVAGRFDLHNPIVPELPWPSVAILCRRGTQRSCILCLHMSVEHPGEWAVTDSDPVRVTMEGGRLHLNGRPFCGDPDGERGVLNGDGPAVLTGRPPESSRTVAVPPPPAPVQIPPATPKPRRRKPEHRPASKSNGALTPKQELVLRLLRMLD